VVARRFPLFLFGAKEDDKMNQELIRIIENIARDKNIDKESIFQDLESAMVSAARKHFGVQHNTEVEVAVHINRENGEYTCL